ncbi:aminotransferase class III-fold pyridoxal phosphate-dependent enzyme [Pseudomonas syringae pv. actinidiae]|nr:aminotransferase class III-fold pyridoxal phosphate-dependent enzyme [Pseudomonas syringae pv. actinidiae]
MSEHISESISFVHSMTLSHGRNAEVWDTTGKRYIDFVGGIGVLNLEHCNPQVVKAIQDQAAKLTHYCFNATPHDPYIQFMRHLTQFVPVSYPLSGMLTNSGAEAAENALKIVRGATGRSAVIAFDGGFHGRTLATLNLNGKVAPYKQKVGVLPGPVFHIPFPSKDNGVSTEQALKALERLFSVEIDVNDVACIIFEPVQGEGGFYVAPKAFMLRLRELCDKHGILLIADEVQTGAGRTGTFFAMEQMGVAADLTTFAKSIAGGFPLAGVCGKAEYMDAIAPGGLGGTYAGSPVACAAALAVLDIFEEEHLLERCKAVGERLVTALKGMQAKYPVIGEVRALGAMIAVELFEDGDSHKPNAAAVAQVVAKARDKGLILLSCGTYGNVLRVLVPLTAEEELLTRGLAILDECFAEIA